MAGEFGGFGAQEVRLDDVVETLDRFVVHVVQDEFLDLRGNRQQPLLGLLALHQFVDACRDVFAGAAVVFDVDGAVFVRAADVATGRARPLEAACLVREFILVSTVRFLRLEGVDQMEGPGAGRVRLDFVGAQAAPVSDNEEGGESS